MERKRVAILSILIWGAIKQRGQFVAELLSKDYDVDYIQFKGVKTMLGLNRHLFVNKPSDSRCLKVKNIFRINTNKISNSVIKIIANCVNTIVLYFYNDFKKYDYIWVTHPLMYSYFKKRLPNNAKIIYDCADDWLEFENTVMSTEMLIESEKELLTRSQQVFCSSDYLKAKLLSRYGVKRTIYVVNNAIGLPPSTDNFCASDEIKRVIEEISALPHPMIYIGTISDWFDFDIMERILKKYPESTLVLVGPTEVVLPKHERIKYYGVIERRYIFSIMDLAFVLIMPFKLNELIKSVNPVKLYEYIYTGKPIIAPSYGESEKFLPYVNLYRSEPEFEAIIESLLKGDRKQLSIKECREYVNKNRWEDRYSQFRKYLI